MSDASNWDDETEWTDDEPLYDDEIVEGFVAQRMAPLIALRHLEPLYAEWEFVLRDFFGELPGPDDYGGPLTHLDVTFSAAGDRYAIRAAGPAERMIPAAAEFFEKVGASPDSLEHLADFGERFQPELLGVWLEVRAGDANCGWYIPEGEMPLAEGILLNRAQYEAVDAWSDTTHVGHFMAAGRSAAEGDALAFIEAPVPGDEVEQVANVLALFSRFDAETPADDLLAAFMNEPHDGLEASLWLLEDGVARSGIRAEEPSLGLIIALAQALGGQDLDLVAQMQGLLQSERASAVEVQVRGNGTDLLVTCSLAG